MRRRNDYSSRILRIGLVNSGVFDSLELNMDVQAVHLVGQNNVGKTSLIALIQFLYFHSLRDMTFSKSISESLAFYFPMEGSYILFNVRTVTGAQRTVGIYGTGTADTRKIFVFDGPFELQDFIDEKSCILSLKDAQTNLIGRNLQHYARFEDYEKALVGQHPDTSRNVQMFDLNLTNYRLLRQLLQGLLNLDRLASQDVQQFLIKLVETDGVKTEINIVQDYEKRYREIQRIQRQLNERKQLEPVIRQWRSLTEEIERSKQVLSCEREQLYHLSSRYLLYAKKRAKQTEREYSNVRGKLASLQEQRDELQQQRAALELRRDTLQEDKRAFHHLLAGTRNFSQIQLEQQIERLTHQKVELRGLLDQIEPKAWDRLQRQYRRLKKERASVLRQMEHHTLGQIWTDENISTESRALLRFLTSQHLISLRSEDYLEDRARFISASQEILEHLGTDGVFQGFGLCIPRSRWYVAEQDVESLDEQLQRLDEDMRRCRRQRDIAKNRQQKEKELRELQSQIDRLRKIERQFEDLARLKDKYGSETTCVEQLRELSARYASLAQRIDAIATEQETLQNRSEMLHADLRRTQEEAEKISEAHASLVEFDTQCPEGIQALNVENLDQEYREAQNRVEKEETEIGRLEQQLIDPQTRLEERYESVSAELSFTAWVKRQLDITEEIDRLENQVYDSYNNLFTELRGGLGKLVQAFDMIAARVGGLNQIIQKVHISNIERIEIRVKKNDIAKAIEETVQHQLDLFSMGAPRFSVDEAQQKIDEWLSKIRRHGHELRLEDLFTLEFSITFVHGSKPMITQEIHQLESHGTEVGVKVVLYLGLIRLLQGQKRSVDARVPFFLDEVGSIDSNNLRQLIDYCDRNNFLPIFASPEIRSDIPCNYVFRRNGSRSRLVNKIFITEAESEDYS